jgi:hypothetical protein
MPKERLALNQRVQGSRVLVRPPIFSMTYRQSAWTRKDDVRTVPVLHLSAEALICALPANFESEGRNSNLLGRALILMFYTYPRGLAVQKELHGLQLGPLRVIAGVRASPDRSTTDPSAEGWANRHFGTPR